MRCKQVVTGLYGQVGNQTSIFNPLPYTCRTVRLPRGHESSRYIRRAEGPIFQTDQQTLAVHMALQSDTQTLAVPPLRRQLLISIHDGGFQSSPMEQQLLSPRSTLTVTL
jgi:hypothetical protein